MGRDVLDHRHVALDAPVARVDGTGDARGVVRLRRADRVAGEAFRLVIARRGDGVAVWAVTGQAAERPTALGVAPALRERQRLEADTQRVIRVD